MPWPALGHTIGAGVAVGAWAADVTTTVAVGGAVGAGRILPVPAVGKPFGACTAGSLAPAERAGRTIRKAGSAWMAAADAPITMPALADEVAPTEPAGSAMFHPGTLANGGTSPDGTTRCHGPPTTAPTPRGPDAVLRPAASPPTPTRVTPAVAMQAVANRAPLQSRAGARRSADGDGMAAAPISSHPRPYASLRQRERW